jgi:predicted secreted protein
MANLRLAMLALAAITVIFFIGFMRVSYPPVFTEADNNSTIVVSQGTLIEIRLHERPASGYVWSINASDGLAVERDIAIPVFPDSVVSTRHMVKNPNGIRCLDIRAIGQGHQNVTCILPKTPQKFVLNIEVESSGVSPTAVKSCII